MRIRLRALYDANFMRRHFVAKTATMTRRRRLRFGCPAHDRSVKMMASATRFSFTA